MEIFQLGANGLAGSIPDAMRGLSWAIEIKVYLNRLTGSLPSSVVRRPSSLTEALNSLLKQSLEEDKLQTNNKPSPLDLRAPKSKRFLRFAIAVPIADPRNRSDFRDKRTGGNLGLAASTRPPRATVLQL